MQRDWEQLLDDLLDLESGLTEWELGFIESLDKWRGRDLSEKQEATLQRIADKLL